MTPSPPLKIRLRGVSKSFLSARGETREALGTVDLLVRAGEFVCVVGPSGCGKTTLVNLMAGFETPTTGTVEIDGAKVVAPDPDHIMIFQDYGLYPWRTVLGNVLFGLAARGVPDEEARERALATLDLVGLRDAAGKHPHELSVGMKQRVALARALAVEPSVLFMDEPFAALDAFTRQHLQTELLNIWQQRRPTVVFVTHDLDEAVLLGQRVVLMAPDPGRIERVLGNDLPYPRERTDAGFIIQRRELFDSLDLVRR